MNTISEFQDALQRLPPSEFERLVLELLRASGRFNEVSFTSRTRDAGVDIVAFESASPPQSGVKWLFEIKQRRLAGVDVARHVSALLGAQVWPGEQAHYVLVISGSVTPEAREILKRRGIDVWGPMHLANMMTPGILEEFFGITDAEATTSAGAEHADSKRRAEVLSEALAAVPPGDKHWVKYQQLVAEILEFLFCPPLDPPRYEFTDADKRNRRDLIFENSTTDGYWAQLRVTYRADYLVVDAKNHGSQLKKTPVLEIAHYLKPYGCGMLALLVSRKGTSGAAAHAIREQWIGANKMIVSVDDAALRKMLTMKRDGNKPEEVIRRLIADFRMSL